MSKKNYTFKEAVALSIVAGILGAIPASISAWQASLSSDAANGAKNRAEIIERNAIVRRARLDERDKILAEANINNVLLVPVENNDAWRIYLACTDKGRSRVDCAKQQRKNIMEANTSGHVGKEIQ